MIAGEQVFAQPWWVRVMNVPAAVSIAVLVAASAMASGIPLVVGAFLWTVVLPALWIGIRAMRSRVTVGPNALVYRGTFRSQTISLDRLVSLGMCTSLECRFVGSIPCLKWRAEDGKLRETDLWCLPITSRAVLGVGETEAVTERLRATLAPYLGRS